MNVSSELLVKARLRLPLSAEELAVLVRASVGDAAEEPAEGALESLARLQGEVQQHVPVLEGVVAAFEALKGEITSLIRAGHLEAAYVAGLAELAAVTIRESLELLDPTRERQRSELVRWLFASAQEQWDGWHEAGHPELSVPPWWVFLAATVAKSKRAALISPEGSAVLGEEPHLVMAVRLAQTGSAGCAS